MIHQQTPTSNASQGDWTLEEKIRLLELFIDKDSGLWEERVKTLQQAFKEKRSADFFTISSAKLELHKIFNRPNPEHHVFGMPSHPRGKEAAELWMKHFRKEIEDASTRRKQMFAVALRNQLDLIRRHQQGKLPRQELEAILLEARERDAQRPDRDVHEARIKQHMQKMVHTVDDIQNVRTFSDYFRYLRGERIPSPVKSPSPVKVPEEPVKNYLPLDDFELPLKAIQNGMMLGEWKANTDEECPDQLLEEEEDASSHISLDKPDSNDGEGILRAIAEFETAELRTQEPKIAKISANFEMTKKREEEEVAEHVFSIKHVEFVESIVMAKSSVSPAKSRPEPPPPPAKQRVLRTHTTAVETTPKEKATRKRKRTESQSEELGANVQVIKPPAKRSHRKAKQSASDSSVEVTIEQAKSSESDERLAAEKSPAPSSSKTQTTPSQESPQRVLRSQSHSATESAQKTSQSEKSPKKRKKTGGSDETETVLSPPSTTKSPPAKRSSQRLPKQTPEPTEKVQPPAAATDDDDLVEAIPAEEAKKPSTTAAGTTPIIADQTPTRQPIFPEFTVTAKLRSSLRRAAIASATPSPAVDSIGDSGLFLRPGKHSSSETIPKQILLTLWRDIHSHRYSEVFSAPVSEELVRGYHSAIKKPMDLRTMRAHIEAGTIHTFGQFNQAIIQMFANAVMYNSTGHFVNSNAKEMLAYALKCSEVVQFPGGQFHAPSLSRQSNCGSSDGGKIPPPTISWASGAPVKNLIKQAIQRQLAAQNAQSGDAIKKEPTEESEEVEARHLFQRRPYRNKRYTIWHAS